MDSNVNISEFNPRRQLERVLSRNRASRVESVLPTPENVDAFKASTTGLLAALEEWNKSILFTKNFPQELLSVMVGYTVPTDLQLVLTSTCRHLKERCHFRSTRRVGISLASDVVDILSAFWNVDEREFQLTATDAEGKLYDFSVLRSLPARTLPVSSCDREIRLRVQAKREYYHQCGSCEQEFRCIPKGYPRPTCREHSRRDRVVL